MSEVFITGLGAVSPGGWGAPALRAALRAGIPLPSSPLARPGWEKPIPARRVPPPATRPAFLAHPRLRRASPISHFTVAAALEALGQPSHQPPVPEPAPERTGLVFCTMTGSVLYSRRFYEEVGRDPATASPLLFPETVFNAPASHLAALLGLSGRVHTEVGDATCLPAAFATATLWLDTGAVDRCLLVAAEEADWLAADGLSLFPNGTVAAEGAGALLLARQAGPGTPTPALARLDSVTAPRPSARAGVPAAGTPKAVLGEAWAAGAAWDCIAAVADVAGGSTPSRAVTITGTGGSAITVAFAGVSGTPA